MKLLAVTIVSLLAFADCRPSISYEQYVFNGGLPLPEAVRAAHPEWVSDALEYEARNGTRIIGGSTSAAGSQPWTVSIRRSSHFCGGSIYNTRTIITAAHCTTGESAANIQIRHNSLNHGSGGTLVQISAIVNHPSYSSSTINNDVSVLRTSAAIALSTTQSAAVSLPAQGSDPASGATSVTAGWGTTSEGGSSLPAALREVSVPIVSRASCRSSYGTSSITDNMVCAGLTAGGSDACQGDSGGPLTVNRVLVGIVSWGNGCARPNYPGVYTRVGNYVTWIGTNAG